MNQTLDEFAGETGAPRKRARRTRTPYAWLGAGALTLGIGAALVSGSAIANADTGQSGTSSGKAESSAASAKPRTAVAHSRPKAARTVAGPVRSASATASQRSNVSAGTARASATATVTDVADISQSAAPDGYGGTSYLPDNAVVVPGSAVRLSLQQIGQTQQLLQSTTWGAGNVAAGLASVVPQMFLAQAAWSLTTWQNSIEPAKAAVANTVGVPVAHQLAQLSLLGTLMLPTVAGMALDAATLTMPLVGLLGAPTAASEAKGLVGAAKTNGQVYAVRLMKTVYTTQQIVYISVNGGPVVPVLLDTGSSGLTIINKYVGQKDLGPPGEKGTSGYGDSTASVSYSYTKYSTKVDFGGGAVTAPFDVRVVDPSSEASYLNYSNAGVGVVGTLGIGVNTASGPTMTALLPGELKDGVLMYENIIGPYGLVVFGPNPLPSKGSISGGPIGDFQVKINDETPVPLRGNVDSGGVWGGLPDWVAGDAAQGSKLKPGTRVSVYTADGLILLYTYVIGPSKKSPDIYNSQTATSSRPNTGNIPFQLGPVYIDNGTPDRLGATHFDIW
ncbi:PecA family PE domain-processing aspartic protease [Mycolicibacterium helvum]|uniref:PE cleavage protein A C-terminal domain-containing protein n=1 Tax=Mycolicibacterium helvum TaxID=1534349 RepID=A0A7I7SYB2_9MYCO|nr:PecA family PE domain-processing aspartic protease [Mycolicibacterium helvum]BBY62022.1 hypothetical protein MHEL_02650 [Mycolicibacterium helvum]